jgi:hypothetical protein
LFRYVDSRQLIVPLALALSAAACLREVAPPSPPSQSPSVASAASTSFSALPKAEKGEAPASAHQLFISALICFGAPVYIDAIGVEPSQATSTIDRACAPLERAAAEGGAYPEDEDAYLNGVRAAIARRTAALDLVQRRELLQLFDKALDAVREARSPWGRGPWTHLVELAGSLTTPALRDEARALATLLEADRVLRADVRKPHSFRVLADLEARLVEQSGRLDASDLRTAIDGFVQRLRTMI